MRRKAMLKLLAFNRMVGRNPHERMLIDSNLFLRLYHKINLNQALEKSENIVISVVIQTGNMIDIYEKIGKTREKGLIFLL